MLAFSFDNTFEGLLCAVFDAYTLKKFPEILLAPDETRPLTVNAVHPVVTARHKAERVLAGLGKRMSREGKNMVLLAFLSEEPGVGTLLFRYMRAVFDSPAASRHSREGDFTDPTMLAVDQIARQVYCEHHRLLGFARFQKTADGIYFAPLAPKYNVLSLIVPHFQNRFAAHPWIVYDVKRGFGYYHDRGAVAEMTMDASILSGGKLPAALLADDEALFETMWQNYFTATAIKERINPKLQAQCLPRRYWPYLTEMRR